MIISLLQVVQTRLGPQKAVPIAMSMYKYVTTSPGTGPGSNKSDKKMKIEIDANMENDENSAAVAGACGGDGENTTAGGFKFEEKEGDLFGCPPSWSLAHCISVDAHMGKGIAVLFRDKFQGVEDIKAQGAGIGGCAVLERDGRFVYYLTTKQRYFHKPTYETLQSSLESMKKHCVENKVQNIAMPLIGCGLDGLQWPKVKQMVHEVFRDSPLSITAYKLGREAAQEARSSKTKAYRGKPRGGNFR